MNSSGEQSADTSRMEQIIREAFESDVNLQNLTPLPSADVQRKVDLLLKEAQEKAERADKMRANVAEVLGDLPFDVMDPSGNTTCLIPVTKEQLVREKDGLVAKATELVERGCVEQAGFYIEASDRNAEVDATLEMAGGEFCLNATLSLASLLQSRATPKFNRQLLIRCSGNPEPVRCACVFVENNTPHVTAIFSADPVIQHIENENGVLVRLPGIAHFIRQVDELASADDEGSGKKLLQDLLQRHPEIFAEDEAVGFIQYDADKEGLLIRPTIYVTKTGTIVSESACGSGTAALTFLRAQMAKESGTRDDIWQVSQPSGKWMTAQFKPKKDNYPSAAVSLQTDVCRICGS